MWHRIEDDRACRHYVAANRAYHRENLLGKRISVRLPDFPELRACLNIKYNIATGCISFAHGLRIGKRTEIYPTTHQPIRCNSEHGREVISRKRQRSKARHGAERNALKETGGWRQDFSMRVGYRAQVVERITVLSTGEITVESYFRRRVYSRMRNRKEAGD